jgi:hypothetical protein
VREDSQIFFDDSRSATAISFAIFMLGFSSAEAEDSKVPNLPSGYYIYLGPQPGKSPPEGFTVTEDKHVLWQRSIKQDSSNSTVPTSVGKAQEKDSFFESYEYPIIEWKAQPIGGLPGAFAKLRTTYDDNNPGRYGKGSVKYRLTLVKVPSAIANPVVGVEIFDKGGFKLANFSALRFHQIPGTTLLEATGDQECREEDYRQAWSYAVNYMFGRPRLQ